MYKKKIAGFVILLTITACAPLHTRHNPIDLQPATKTATWKNGAPLLENENPALAASANFVRDNDIGIIFHLTLKNNGTKDILIAPGNIRCSNYPQNINASLIKDPELILSDLKSRRDKVIVPEVYTTGDFIIDTLSVVATLSGHEPNIDHEKEQEEYRRREEAQSRALQLRKDLEQQYIYYQSSLLRKHTLEPGETLSGDVYCPRKSLGGDGITVTIAHEQGDLTFNWIQVHPKTENPKKEIPTKNNTSDEYF